MFEMPCGRKFDSDVAVLLHAEDCRTCDAALDAPDETQED